MKTRDLSLMITGALIAAGAVTIALTFFNPTRAQAQAAGSIQAPGGVSMVVTAGALDASGTGNLAQGGVVTMQDAVNRKVTVVSYSYTVYGTPGTAPTVTLSTNASFTY